MQTSDAQKIEQAQASLDSLTIEQARVIMRSKLLEGTTCICCKQPVKMYRRTLTSSMCYGLILIYCHSRAMGFPPKNWIHLENFFKALDVPSSIRGDMPKCRFWNFLEQDGEDKEDGNPNSGNYCITRTGIDFVEGKIKANSHVMLYNNKKYPSKDGSKQITIQEALKNKFDYNKLMGI